MRKHVPLLSLAFAFTFSASADTITGSFVLSSLGATINNTNLATSTEFVPATLRVGINPVGSFAGFTGENGTGGVIDTAAVDTFSLTFSFGTFVATTGQILTQNANFLHVFYVGTFTGAGTLAGDSGLTSVRVSLNQSGPSVSYGGTLESLPGTSPDPVPEPSTYALIGVSLLGLAALRRQIRR